MDDADQTRPTSAPSRPAATIDNAAGPTDPRTESPTGSTPRPRNRTGGSGAKAGAKKSAGGGSGNGVRSGSSGNGSSGNGSKRRAGSNGSAGSGRAVTAGDSETASPAKGTPATTSSAAAASTAAPPSGTPRNTDAADLPAPSPAATAPAADQPERPHRAGGLPTAARTRPASATEAPPVIDVPDAPDDPSGPVEIPAIVPAVTAPAAPGAPEVADPAPARWWRRGHDHSTDTPADRTAEQPATPLPPVPTVPIGELSDAEFSDTDGTAGLPALHRPVRPARSLRQPVVVRRSRRPRVRKVTRVVRHVDTWSVFKVAVVFHAFLYMVCLTSGVLLWQVAQTTGTVDNIERFFESFGWQSFELKGGEIYHNAWIAGLFLAVGGTGLVVLAATLFNLITDLVGGIRLTVLEEEVIAREERGLGWRRAFRRHGAATVRGTQQQEQPSGEAPAAADEGVRVVSPEPPAAPTGETQRG